jgi:hypothetical protein
MQLRRWFTLFLACVVVVELAGCAENAHVRQARDFAARSEAGPIPIVEVKQSFSRVTREDEQQITFLVASREDEGDWFLSSFCYLTCRKRGDSVDTCAVYFD